MMASSSGDGDGAAAADKAPPLVHVAFNHDATCFIAATASGVRAFSCSPLAPVFGRHSLVPVVSPADSAATAREVASAEALNDCLSAVVVRDPTTEDTVHFCIGLEGRRLSTSVTPRSPSGAVLGLRLVGEHMAIAGEDKCAVYAMAGVRRVGPVKVKEVETGANPRGLCALAARPRPHPHSAEYVLAAPRPEKGAVQVCRPGAERLDVRAHTSGAVACLALSRDGQLLATAGTRGTLVRIFSTDDGKMLQELRRGIHTTGIQCIAFSPDSKWLVVSSDKATVHVFSVNVNPSSTTMKNVIDIARENISGPPPTESASQGSSFFKRIYTGFLPSYFSSEWSLAQFRLREGVKYSVAFDGQPHTILIIGMDGSFYRCAFDPVAGGEMVQLEYRDFRSIKSSKWV